MPNGFLLCNGASVSRSDYPDLAEALGETGSTFSLPDYRDRVPQGAGTVSPNVGIDAGIPNAEGAGHVTGNGSTANMCWFNVGGQTGCCYSSSSNLYNGDGYVSNFNSNNAYGITISLERDNSIFGNSSSVQPPALTCHFLVKA